MTKRNQKRIFRWTEMALLLRLPAVRQLLHAHARHELLLRPPLLAQLGRLLIGDGAVIGNTMRSVDLLG